MVRSEKYFSHIIFILNLAADKKISVIVKSRGELMHPNVRGIKISTVLQKKNYFNLRIGVMQ